MAITTIADLFAAGAQYHAIAFNNGSVTNYANLPQVLAAAYGSDFQASAPTVARFNARVIAAQSAGEIAVEGGQIVPSSVPQIPGQGGAGRYRQGGILVIQTEDDIAEGREGSIRLPYSLATDDPLTADELCDILLNSQESEAFTSFGDSAKYRRAFSDLVYAQLANEISDCSTVNNTLYRV